MAKIRIFLPKWNILVYEECHPHQNYYTPVWYEEPNRCRSLKGRCHTTPLGICCLSFGLGILLHAGEQEENWDNVKTTYEVINYAAAAVAFEAG